MQPCSDAYTLPFQRPASWMQLVLHYSCGLADLTLVELNILPLELENIAFIVYGTRQILISAQEVQSPWLAGWPFELWNRIMRLCWADFLNPLNRSYRISASVYMVLHKDLQPNNPNQTCWWNSITFLTCFLRAREHSPPQEWMNMARTWSRMRYDNMLTLMRLDSSNRAQDISEVWQSLFCTRSSRHDIRAVPVIPTLTPTIRTPLASQICSLWRPHCFKHNTLKEANKRGHNHHLHCAEENKWT